MIRREDNSVADMIGWWPHPCHLLRSSAVSWRWSPRDDCFSVVQSSSTSPLRWQRLAVRRRTHLRVVLLRRKQGRQLKGRSSQLSWCRSADDMISVGERKFK